MGEKVFLTYGCVAVSIYKGQRALEHLPVSHTVRGYGDKKDGHCKDMRGLVSKEDCGTWGRLPCLLLPWIEVHDSTRPELHTSG